MKLIFELSGEHETLPQAELLSVLDATGKKHELLDVFKGAAVVKCGLNKADVRGIAKRLALCKSINNFITQIEGENFKAAADKVTLGERSFRVRLKRVEGLRPHLFLPDIEKEMGARIVKRTGAGVNLLTPATDLRIIVSEKCVMGTRLETVDRGSFEMRKAQFREFFSPVSLHPRLARALVNLTATGPGKTVLDPFCGTGGLLIEAGLSGRAVVGTDIDAKMVAGCQLNLMQMGITPKEMLQSDVGELHENFENVDAIATDPPYGRSSSTHGEEKNQLMDRAFESFNKILKSGGRAAVCLPDEKSIDIGRKHMDLSQVHKVRVHRSLDRHFCVFKKK